MRSQGIIQSRKWPDKRTILASYEATFAATWGRKNRDRYAELASYGFPRGLSADKAATDEWETLHGGGMRTAGVGGGITGRGGHLLIADDLIKNAEEAQSEVYRNKIWDWFTSTFYTRGEPGAKYIVVGTPWHRDDYLARIERELKPHVIRLPAIAHENDLLGRKEGEALWPERYSVDDLRKIEASIGPYYWGALYDTYPPSHEQAEWPMEFFDSIWSTEEEWPDRFEVSCVSVDPSKGKDGGDYCARAFVGYARKTLWVDMDVDRIPSSEIVQRTCWKANQYNVDAVGCESDAWQDLLLPEFVRYCRDRGQPAWPLYPMPTHGVPKEVRIRRLGGWLQQRRIKIRRRGTNHLLVDQLRDFPLGKKDDGPDALEQGVRLLNTLASRTAQEQDSRLVPV